MFGIPLKILWLAAVIVLVLVEAATMGLECIWFAIGALAALIAALLGLPLLGQLIVFIAVSGICLVLIKPVALKYLYTNKTPTNADRIIGAEGVVTDEISNLDAKGLVKVKGQIWTARSSDDSTVIPAGEKVIIKEISGVKVIVEKAAR